MITTNRNAIGISGFSGGNAYVFGISTHIATIGTAIGIAMNGDTDEFGVAAHAANGPAGHVAAERHHDVGGVAGRCSLRHSAIRVTTPAECQGEETLCAARAADSAAATRTGELDVPPVVVGHELVEVETRRLGVSGA